MRERRADAPSLTVVLAGGVGVLAVVGFVVALALGGGGRTTPGERVALVRADGPAGVAVLAGRCRDQRVTDVALRSVDGDVLWRVTSRKGAIERRFVVGGEPPVGAELAVPLRAPLPAVVAVSVAFDGPDGEDADETAARPADAPPEAGALGPTAPGCGGDVDLGGTLWLFAAGAAVVVGGYGLMLTRLRRP